MARRIVQLEPAKQAVKSKDGKKATKKKKHHGCRNCLIAWLVINLVFCGIVYFVGNYFTTNYIDMKLWECFAVVGDLRSSNGNKIVTNKYSRSDLNAFDLQIKRQLFLKDDVDFGVEKVMGIVTSMLGGGGEGEGSQETYPSSSGYIHKTVDVLNASATDSVLDELETLYVRDNLDLNRLLGYEESLHDTEYVLRLSDKMLAAVIDYAIDDVVGALGYEEMLKSYGVNKPSDIIKLEQIVFGTADGTLKNDAAAQADIEEGESSPEEPQEQEKPKEEGDAELTKIPSLKVTISVNARKILSHFINELAGQDLSILANIVLPKRIYATAQIPVISGARLEHNVFINNMNAAKMNRAYRLVSGVTGLMGSPLDLKKTIGDAVDSAVGGMIGKVNDYVPLSEAKGGIVSIDVFETVIGIAKINEKDGVLKPEDEQIHAPQIIRTLGGVIASDAEDAIKEEYDFAHQYFDSQEDKVVYKKELGAGEKYIDYKEEFIAELKSKYLLADDVTFDDIVSLLGIGGESSGESGGSSSGSSGGDSKKELLDLFDASKLHDTLKEEDKRVGINARMLGAILQSQMNSMLGDNETFSKYDLTLEYVYTYLEGGNHNMLEASLSLETAKLLDGDNKLMSVITGLLSERIAVTVSIDITPSSDENFEYIAGKISYNGLTYERTDEILSTVRAFSPSLDISSMLGQIEEPIRSAIKTMSEVMPITIESSKIDYDETVKNLPPAIVLPSIFETIKEMMFKDDEDITAEGIENVLIGIDEVNDEDFEETYIGEDGISVKLDEDGKQVTTYEKSLKNILKAYYINDEGITTFDDLFGNKGVANKDGFSAMVDKFDFDSLYHDNSSIEEGRPVFEDNDLAALILEKMTGDSSGLYDNLLSIKGLRIDRDEITGKASLIIFIEIGFEKFLGDNSDKLKLLPADKMYLKATVSLNKDDVGYYDKNSDDGNEWTGEGEAPSNYTPFYRTEFTINKMTDETYNTAMAMINSLSGEGGSLLKLDATARDVGSIIYDSVNEITKALGGDIEFVDGGVKLMSIYSYLAVALKVDAGPTEIKMALQGLAALREGEEKSDNCGNYALGDIINNEISDEATVNVDTEALSFKMSDRAFGRGLVEGYTVQFNEIMQFTSPALLPDSDKFSLRQLNILCGAQLASRIEYLGGFGETINPGSTYIELTFEMSLGGMASGDIASKVPATVYFTVLFEKKAEGEYERTYYRINSVSKDTQDVLFKIAGINTASEGGIDAEIQKSVNALNSYALASFGEITDENKSEFEVGGFGYIHFAPFEGVSERV